MTDPRVIVGITQETIPVIINYLSPKEATSAKYINNTRTGVFAVYTKPEPRNIKTIP